MLTSLVLTLTAEADAVLPAQLGRAHYAETLALIRRHDPALAAQIHASDGPKPLTCSGLLGAPAARQSFTVHSGRQYAVRITSLTPALSELLMATLATQPPSHWTLHGHSFAVCAVASQPEEHPWAGAATYEALAAAQLLQPAQLPRQVTLEFASPTAFRSAGMTVPVPLPDLVFGSLVERWNHFSPITLSPEMRRYGAERVALSRYRLESQAVGQKDQGLRIGAVGQATYTALGGDRYWLALLQMLSDFARYSGVGVQTATGMGQARRVGR
ncbi:MAG: CRISPR system precrRNA processing endoribonuclease RAMP protein Cas6 [Caldilineaceae bacterium]|nr:CRISPR system precrRNA processing endoribonuclease RAMP protein Cas6 [Caldilineaceae bacterium]